MDQEWHEKETRRLNKQSLRRALFFSTLIVVIAVWWFKASYQRSPLMIDRISQ